MCGTGLSDGSASSYTQERSSVSCLSNSALCSFAHYLLSGIIIASKMFLGAFVVDLNDLIPLSGYLFCFRLLIAVLRGACMRGRIDSANSLAMSPPSLIGNIVVSFRSVCKSCATISSALFPAVSVMISFRLRVTTCSTAFLCGRRRWTGIVVHRVGFPLTTTSLFVFGVSHNLSGLSACCV